MPPISVTVPSLPTSRGNVAVSEAAAPHTEYTVQVFYLRNEGLVQNPVAGPAGTPCELVQWSAPYGVKVVVWQAARIGAMPIYPDMDPKDQANEKLLDWKFGPCVPMLMPDGKTYEFVASGVYVYALRVPPNKTVGFSPGSAPVSTGNASQFVAKGNNFRQLF